MTIATTPRECWEAAVAMQHRLARALATLPGDAGERIPDLVNAATDELRFAYDAAARAGSAPSDEEWAAAYKVHREALMAWYRRGRREDALERIETARREACELAARATGSYAP